MNCPHISKQLSTYFVTAKNFLQSNKKAFKHTKSAKSRQRLADSYISHLSLSSAHLRPRKLARARDEKFKSHFCLPSEIPFCRLSLSLSLPSWALAVKSQTGVEGTTVFAQRGPVPLIFQGKTAICPSTAVAALATVFPFSLPPQLALLK